MLLHALRQTFHHLPGSVKGLAGNDIKDTSIAKLQLLSILSLRQPVSIKEQRSALNTLYFLAFVLQFRP